MITEYKIENIIYRMANINDNNAIQEMLSENSMDSWVNLSLERKLIYFNAQNIMGENYTMVAIDTTTNNYIGMYSCRYMNIYLNGKVQEIAYLCELRLNKKYRNKIKILKNGYKSLNTLLPKKNEQLLYITSVSTQNSKARRVLEAEIKGMPKYTPISKMNTLIFSSNFICKQKRLRQATKNDISRIAEFYSNTISSFQFAPYISKQWLEEELSPQIGLTINDFYFLENENKKIETCLALWDQRAFKQSIIKGYKPPLKQFQFLYNLFAKLTKRVVLPQVNSMLEQIYIAFFASLKNDIQLDIIKEVAEIIKSKGADCCILGLSYKHPSLELLKKNLKANIYETNIEIVSLDGEKQSVKLEEKYLIQPEVAIL